jgi:hypothetical protein
MIERKSEGKYEDEIKRKTTQQDAVLKSATS